MDSLVELVQDGSFKQAVVSYLASRGGKATLEELVVMLFVRKKQKYKLAKNYFKLLPHDFIMIGGRVCLSHKSAADVHVNDPDAGVQSDQPPAPINGSRCYVCKLCGVRCSTMDSLREHNSGAQHRINQQAQSLKQRGAIHANQGGVSVSEMEPVDGTDSHMRIRVGQECVCRITATNLNDSSVELKSFQLLRKTPGIGVHDDTTWSPGEPCELEPSEMKQFFIRFKPTAVGNIIDELILEFDGFNILRGIAAACEPDLGAGLPDIRAQQPYQAREKLQYRKQEENYEAGIPPPRSRTTWVNDPGDTRPPEWITRAAEEGRMHEVETMLKMPTPGMTTFIRKLKIALWVEELQHTVDIRQYDLEGVTMVEAGRGGLLALQVPGLAENRPSVMRGDAVYVRYADQPTGREYQGFVHVVQREEVLLKFSPQFHVNFISGRKFNVRFSISRSTFVFMHAALNIAGANEVHPGTLLGCAGMVVPPLLPPPPPPGQLVWTRRRQGEELNEEQKAAVHAILRGWHAPMPYMIFGPPGTGKTVTITEAAVQVYKMDKSSVLLLTAPSNSAADQLAERVINMGVPASTVYRICAYSRPTDDMPVGLLDISNWDTGEGAFLLDDTTRTTINCKRVVVSTCLMASKLHALGVQQGHFTHIFIDEAGHAEEPLSLASIAGLISNQPSSARLILAGDPQQLGPVILSPIAQRHGLATSAMERLIKVAPYARREGATLPYDPNYITKLVDNYRSHEDILHLPNKLFYDGELKRCAAWEHTHGLLGFLPHINKEMKANVSTTCPIIFHAVVGNDEREGYSPSWFNQMEAKLVLQYVMAMQSMRSNRPQLTDIGVISPYRKQVQKIRSLLVGKFSGNHVKVGSVEEFQGQERRAIIISTVRSSVEHLEYDTKHRLGFLSNQKRFNVAITRAKALLVVVGNPHVLKKDPCWSQFLTMVYQKGGCTGSAMPEEIISAASGNPPAPMENGSSMLDMLTGLIHKLTLDSTNGSQGQAGSSSQGNGHKKSMWFVESAPMQAEGGEIPRME